METDKISSLAPLRCQIRRSKHTGVEDPADHAGEHHEEHGQKLQVAAQDAAGLDVGQVLGRQATLDDHLQQK